VTSLEIADSALSNVEEEFVSIQNQLSKSFNFIKENSYGGLGVRDDLKSETASTSEIKLEQVLNVCMHVLYCRNLPFSYCIKWVMNDYESMYT